MHVLAEQAQARVTGIAEQSTNLAAGVVVIYEELKPIAITTRTPTFLLLQQKVELVYGKTVPTLKVLASIVARSFHR